MPQAPPKVEVGMNAEKSGRGLWHVGLVALVSVFGGSLRNQAAAGTKYG